MLTEFCMYDGPNMNTPQQLVWRDKPQPEEIEWYCLVHHSIFSNWLTMNWFFTNPQPGMVEYCFSDGAIHQNSEYHIPSVGMVQKWAPFKTSKEGGFIPVEWPALDGVLWKQITSIPEEKWVQIFESRGWKIANPEETVPYHVHYGRECGHNVYKHPKWSIYICPFYHKEGLCEVALPFVIAEDMNFEEFKRLIQGKQ